MHFNYSRIKSKFGLMSEAPYIVRASRRGRSGDNDEGGQARRSNDDDLITDDEDEDGIEQDLLCLRLRNQQKQLLILARQIYLFIQNIYIDKCWNNMVDTYVHSFWE